LIPRRYRVIVCRGPECGERLGSQGIHAAFVTELRRRGLDGRVDLGWQSCFGRCRQGPNILVRPVSAYESRFLVAVAPVSGPGTALYNGVAPRDASRIIDEHVVGGRIVRDLVKRPEDAAARPSDAVDAALGGDKPGEPK
jgi:(2Fe-2S) ferredoxin